MIEYIFFDSTLRDKFVHYAKRMQVDCTEPDDPLGLVVAVSEDLPDDMVDELEQRYDELQLEQASLSKGEGALKRLAGIRFNLPDGQSRMLPLSTELANRLLASFSLEEIQGLFDAVADCALNPKDEHLCKIFAARDQKKV